MDQRPLFRLVRQGGLYALGNVGIKLSGLILAPFFLDATYLTLDAYGQFGVLLIFAQLCIHIIGLGLSSGLLKYVGREKIEESHAPVFFTALASVTLCALLAFTLFVLFSEGIAGLLLEGRGQAKLIQLLAIYICCKVIGAIPLMILRIKERAGLYTAVVIIEMVVLIGSIYLLLVQQNMGLEGVIRAYAIASGISTSILVSITLIVVERRYSSRLVRPLFEYGSPLIFVGIAGIILHAGDRFLLKALTSDAEVGMYEWAARMSGVLNLFIVQSFQLAFTVIGLKTLGKGEESFHRQSFRHYTIWAGWATLGVSMLSYELTLFLNKLGADEHYLRSTDLVLPLTYGAMIYGLYIVINNVLYATSQTSMITRNVIISAVVNILLNVLLIPIIGALGAAFATVLSYGVLVWLTYRIAEKEMSINYSWSNLNYVTLILITLYGLGQLVLVLDFWNGLVIRLLILTAYLPIIVCFRIYTYEEVKAVRQYILKLIS